MSVSAIDRQLVESSVVLLTCFALPQSAGNKLITHHAYTYMGKVNWGNSGHGVTPDISSFQACNSDKKKRIAFRLGVKTVLLLTFL